MTDIHLTHFGHAERSTDFERFCNEIIKALIKPRVTVVSGGLSDLPLSRRRAVFDLGDLTHNRDQTFASQQYEEEWKIYRDLLRRTNVTEATLWLDTRGNHGKFLLQREMKSISERDLDGFMDPDPESKDSFYRSDFFFLSARHSLLLKDLFQPRPRAFRFLSIHPSNSGERHLFFRRAGHVSQTGCWTSV